MPDPATDLSKLVADYRAAESALRSAVDALNTAIPDRTVVLQRPGADSGFVKVGNKTAELRVQYIEGGV